MSGRPAVLASLLAGTMLLLGAGRLSATIQDLSFATFTEQAPSLSAFTLTNNGQAGSNGLVTFNTTLTPIWFTISPSTPTTAAGTADAGQTINAYLWMTSSTSTHAVSLGTLLDQPFGGTTILIQSVADYDLHDSNYLLVATYPAGDMVGSVNGKSNALYDSSDVTYSSYYLNFGGAQDGALSFAFSGIKPGYKLATNGLVADFAASGAGTFSATFTPEPEMCVLFCTSLLALGWTLRRKRRNVS